jgi:hypothetical protein
MVTFWVLVSPFVTSDVTMEPAGEGNTIATPPTEHTGVDIERVVVSVIAAGTALSEVLTATISSPEVENPESTLTVLAPPGSVSTPFPPAPAGSKFVAQEMVLLVNPERTVVRTRLSSNVGPNATAVATVFGFGVSTQEFAPPAARATLVTCVPISPEPVVRIM